MKEKQLSMEEKRLDTDLWIILLSTLGAFLCYAIWRNEIMDFIKNDNISIIPRLLLNAAVQFGVAGLGITIVCIWRKEKFTQFGLTQKNIFQAIFGTIICFIPSISYILLSGQFNGYRPFSILITDYVIASGIPFSIIGMILIVIVWGFFEGFNYAVICEKINRRYPSYNPWLDYGAISCAIICILFHPFSISFLGIVEIITTFIAIYGMLIVKKKTGNAWGCVFAFCFIWNAIKI
ncbi:MAG: hypothetical protein Q4P25_04035 [Tissierellia bacterium]|nr:hypothetical protein [Tissierellia bacterium]